MIEWIRKTTSGIVEIGADGDVRTVDRTLVSYLNRLCIGNLSTLAGRIEGVQRRYGFKTRVPVYVDEEHLFLPLVGLRSPGSLLVNRHAVISFNKLASGGVEIRLVSGNVLAGPSHRTFSALLERASLIEAY